MRDISSLHSIVETALRDTIEVSVERGLGSFTFDVANASLLATETALAARESGAIDEIFNRLVKDWILRNKDKVAEILAKAKEGDDGDEV